MAALADDVCAFHADYTANPVAFGFLVQHNAPALGSLHDDVCDITVTIEAMSTSETPSEQHSAEVKPPLPRAELRDVIDLALWAGQLQLQHGADTERAENTIHHLGTALGCDWIDAFISPNAIVITTLSGDEFRTRIRRLVRFGGVDMNIVAGVNDLSYRAEAHQSDRVHIRKKLEQIDTMPKLYNRLLVIVIVGLACAAFCRLFGGDWAAFGVTWVAAAVAMFVRQEMTRRYFNQFLTVVVTAFVATMVAATGVLLDLGSQPQIALAASVLLLVPGVPLINASKDLLQGHMVTGLVRGVTGALISLAIALGIGLAITILPVTRLWTEFAAPPNLFVDALWAAVAATGFAVLFNVPYRTLFGCAVCGALGHASRTFMLQSDLPAANHIVMASLIGATVVGSLGFLIARHMQLPSIVFTVSGVIPMVPGTYAFSAMLGILRMADIVGVGGPTRTDLILLGEVVPNTLTTAFVLAALAVGIAAPSLLFRRRKPVV
ncbi:MAG: threonine/serine exporter family protein [Anaerolineae bacterium]|nr:threonine/serine exporter family protein [Anaerolineae bacterium]